MIPIPTGVRVWLATGHTDMRCGFPSLALRVQEVLKRDAMGGGLFCFRGKRGDLLKVIWHGVLQSMKEVNMSIGLQI
ncbi:IS66 family insertion sequence element accessory protein TnpB [Bradyrhizobium sp. 2S1]|uniref:IS66 family insertion sequence element accessory protein TnpB n=1 Tax=Bradyrhizobium sp. 2S1 TaxID=1404429 RepID=UPI00140D655B|nr:IS66 family insertion sequence element accessory protein TnpB [Bradyrhizobium sp. 2S1]MCK7668271.1 IS66 family insertion sequence element accessory protein TnpB [Bradyrhizobium sp. 2S1]